MLKHVAIALAATALGACETMPEFMTQPSLGSSTQSDSASQGASTAAETSAPSYGGQSSEQQLLELERQLSAAAQERGLGNALAGVVDPNDGFVVRSGHLYEGADQVAAGLVTPPSAGPIYWQVDRVHVSRGGDMGMTSGRYVQVMTGAEAVQGRYVAVWRRDVGGEWRLLSESRIADPPRATARRR
ncbi:MAG: DUF4440 domain-containing protein [Hyphomonadaceae bacterium]